jgi:hypothetical protein
MPSNGRSFWSALLTRADPCGWAPDRAGLPATGMLAETIRELQAAIARDGS